MAENNSVITAIVWAVILALISRKRTVLWVAFISREGSVVIENNVCQLKNIRSDGALR